MSLLTICPEQYSDNKVYFAEPKINSVIDGLFSKITYSDESFCMHGLYISIPICSKVIHSSTLIAINNIEKSLLSIYSNKDTNVCRLVDVLQSKFAVSSVVAPQGLSSILVIKISGVWENRQGNIGLSFRILDA